MESIGWAWERAACARRVRGWEAWADELERSLARARVVGSIDPGVAAVAREVERAVVTGGRARVAAAREIADGVCGFGQDAGRVDAEVVRHLAALVALAGTGVRR